MIAFSVVAYRNPFSLPYHHLVEPIFLGQVSTGLLGIGLPTKIGIYGVLLSRYRGLFFLCPFLALVFAGFSRWYTRGHEPPALRREMWAVAALIGASVLFTTSYYAWDGGGSTGSRHLVPAEAAQSDVPHLAFPLQVGQRGPRLLELRGQRSPPSVVS